MEIDISKHFRLVYHVINKYRYRPTDIYDLDDLFQIGCIGLIKAIENYDPSRGTKFSTHAAIWIRSALGQALKKCERQKRQATLIRIDERVKGTSALLAEVIPSHYDLEEGVITQERLMEAMRIDPVVVSYLMIGYNQREVSEALGVTIQRINARIRTVREKVTLKSKLMKGVKKCGS